jgi:hypothetical protein
VVAVPAAHGLQRVDQQLPVGVAQPGVGVERQVAAGRHAALHDGVGRVAGVAARPLPGGEVQLVPALLDVAGDQPGERRHLAVERPARLVAVAVVAGGHGQLAGTPARPGRIACHRRVGAEPPERQQLQQHGRQQQAETGPQQHLPSWDPHAISRSPPGADRYGRRSAR